MDKSNSDQIAQTCGLIERSAGYCWKTGIPIGHLTFRGRTVRFGTYYPVIARMAAAPSDTLGVLSAFSQESEL